MASTGTDVLRDVPTRDGCARAAPERRGLGATFREWGNPTAVSVAPAAQGYFRVAWATNWCFELPTLPPQNQQAE